jgi:hypothetical protein
VEDHPIEEREEEDGSQQNDAEDHNEQEDESPRGNKRRRVNGGQSAVTTSGSQPRPLCHRLKHFLVVRMGKYRTLHFVHAFSQVHFSVTFLDLLFASNFATSLPTIMSSSHRGRI